MLIFHHVRFGFQHFGYKLKYFLFDAGRKLVIWYMQVSVSVRDFPPAKLKFRFGIQQQNNWNDYSCIFRYLIFSIPFLVDSFLGNVAHCLLMSCGFSVDGKVAADCWTTVTTVMETRSPDCRMIATTRSWEAWDTSWPLICGKKVEVNT